MSFEKYCSIIDLTVVKDEEVDVEEDVASFQEVPSASNAPTVTAKSNGEPYMLYSLMHSFRVMNVFTWKDLSSCQYHI